jgi:hypothetical protein
MGRAVADSLQKLTEKQLRATLMVAEDEKTDEAIAAEVGISRVTLHQWKKKPEFAAEVDAHVEAFKDRALSEGFADKRARLVALNGLAQDLLRDLAEPATDDTPRGTYRIEKKISANGEVIEYEVYDKAKTDSFRGLLDDIASEMGDRKTVTELTGKDGEALVLGLVGVDLGKV